MKVKYIGKHRWVWYGTMGTTVYDFMGQMPDKIYDIPEDEYTALKGEKNWFFIFLSEPDGKPLCFNPKIVLVENEETIAEVEVVVPKDEPAEVELDDIPAESLPIKEPEPEKKTVGRPRKRRG